MAVAATIAVVSRTCFCCPDGQPNDPAFRFSMNSDSTVGETLTRRFGTTLWRAFKSERCFLGIFGLAVAAAVALHPRQTGDYGHDAKPAIDALAGGDVVGALTGTQPIMGPLSIVLRAPFAAAAHALGAGELTSYRIGGLVCMVAAVVFAAALVTAFPRPTRRRLAGLLVVVLAVATPAAAAALHFGHPEELLAAALSVGAVVAGIRGRPVAAAVLLGLALATKQWAVLAIGPTLLAIGRTYWWRVGAVGCAIGAVLMLPQLLANYHAVAAMTKSVAVAPHPHAFVQSWWYIALPDLPPRIAAATHPAIILAAIPLTLLAYRRSVGARGVLPLLALLFLIRCVLDPVNNYYYHLPLLFALLAWDVQTRRRLPYTTLAVTAALVVTNSFLTPSVTNSFLTLRDAFWASLFYLGWTYALAIYLMAVVVRRPHPSPARPERVFRTGAYAASGTAVPAPIRQA